MRRTVRRLVDIQIDLNWSGSEWADLSTEGDARSMRRRGLQRFATSFATSFATTGTRLLDDSNERTIGRVEFGDRVALRVDHPDAIVPNRESPRFFETVVSRSKNADDSAVGCVELGDRVAALVGNSYPVASNGDGEGTVEM